MKFQNSSIHGFKVMLCIKKRDERTDGRTDGRTNNPEAICPSNFFEVGGIKMWVAFSKNIRVYAISYDQSFNDMLTNDIVSFEQLGPDCQKINCSNAVLLIGTQWVQL